MALTMYNLKKWSRMIFGKSILHVNQGVGKVYSKETIKGYYNDLTEKVLRESPDVKIPVVELDTNKWEYFPIAIFQFGLGAYDLYLIHKEKKYLDIFKADVEWAIENQREDGSWDSFSFRYPEAPFSAMAQGEGISLLLRAYVFYGENLYFQRAKKAMEFMLKSIEEGGTTIYDGKNVYLQEVVSIETVLNGWIFALFGLIDYLKADSGNKVVRNVYEKTVQTLLRDISRYDCGFWSLYQANGTMCSSFYHKLHIAQLKVLYELTGEQKFRQYADIWSGYEKNRYYKIKAFMIKAIQKIKE